MPEIIPMKHATDYPYNLDVLQVPGTPDEAKEKVSKRYPGLIIERIYVWKNLCYVAVAWNCDPRVYRMPQNDG